MDLSRIKKIVKQNGDKVILVENDEPEIVMMSFSEYEKMVNGSSGAETASPVLANREPADIVLASSDGDDDMRETEFVGPPVSAVASDLFLRPQEVRLEDLPL